MQTASTTTLDDNQIRLGSASAFFGRTIGVIGLLGFAISLGLGYASGWETFFRSYILNFAFVVSLALGALFFVLVQHVTGAGWSVVVRRLAEAVAATIPWLAILGLPILIPVFQGMKEVYPWANAAEVEHDHLLQVKQPYLNPAFFTARAIFYFALWSLMAVYYARQSVSQDETGDARPTLRMQRFSGVSIVLLGVSVTFFSIDLIMSMTPHWYSTIYGVYYATGAVVGFFALLAIMMTWLQSAGRLNASITAEHYHDVGKYIFAFITFWAYIAFSQYMLVWYANLPEETAWYYVRQNSTWWVGVALVLIAGHFIVPFWALISRSAKRNKYWLALVAVWVLVMHWGDIYYLVGPQAHHFHSESSVASHVDDSPLRVTDISLLVGLGGLFVWLVVSRLRQAALLPKRDPRLAESLAFENF